MWESAVSDTVLFSRLFSISELEIPVRSLSSSFTVFPLIPLPDSPLLQNVIESLSERFIGVCTLSKARASALCALIRSLLPPCDEPDDSQRNPYDAHLIASHVAAEAALKTLRGLAFFSSFEYEQRYYVCFHHLVLVQTALFQLTWREEKRQVPDKAIQESFLELYERGLVRLESVIEEAASESDTSIAAYMRYVVDVLPR